MVIDAQFKTIKCDGGSDCTKTITFNVAEGKEVASQAGNEWMKAIRLVQTPDGRVLVYCSDVCEISGTRTGQHNIPVPKKIIEAANPAAVAAAAQAAEAARASDANLKSGSGGPVIIP
jgi:hypothetical protein